MRTLTPLAWMVCTGLLAATAHAQQPAGTELIRALQLPLSVPSVVANNSDRPEHLVDGNLESAWNGQTGMLTGGSIFVRVPPGATVDELRMTAGFTRSTARGDLFTQNHRVRRIAVSRMDGGAPVTRSFDLDINRRDLQSFPLHQGAGLYQIQFLAFEPGTQRSWREPCVSELQLWGRGSNQEWLIPEPLVVDVGPLQGLVATTGPFATPQAFCASLRANRDRRRCREISVCDCTVGRAPAVTAQLTSGTNPVLGVQLVTETRTPDEPTTCHLAVQTAGGWFGISSLAACADPDPSSSNLAGYVRASMSLQQIAVRNGANGEPVLRVAFNTDEGMWAAEGYDEERRTGTRWEERTRRSLALQCHFVAGRPECLPARAIAPTRVR